MLWFFIALTGYILQAIVFILDKKILTSSVSKPVVYTFYSTIFLLPVFLLVPFSSQIGLKNLYNLDLLLAITSGITFGLGLWLMFIAVKQGEASHINPFIGGVIAIATYLFSYLFFQEVLSSYQIAGVIFVIFASLLLSFEKSKKHSGFHIGFLWAVISGLLFAVSHVAAKYIYINYDFFTGIIYTRGSIGFVGLLTLIYPSVRKSFRKAKTKKAKSKKTSSLLLVVINKILGVSAVLLIQYAIAIGSVTLVNAMAGLQYALMFVFIYLLTKFTPRLFKEFFTKRELLIEVIALIFVVLGSVLFVL